VGRAVPGPGKEPKYEVRSKTTQSSSRFAVVQFAICNKQFAICNKNMRARHILNPIPNPQRARTAQCAGLTLFEVLLVLAILVIMGSFTWPILRGTISREKLRSAAYQVRTAWARARIDAMNTGRVQRFTYDPQSGVYRVESGASDSDEEFYSSEQELPDQRPRIYEETLPEGVRFAALNAADDSRDTTTQQLPGGFGTTQETACRPLFFYPDGTTSTAQVTLGNTEGRGIVISMRGLTGVVNVGEITALQNGVLP
jgi:Tfp pilus assembly protein FimT